MVGFGIDGIVETKGIFTTFIFIPSCEERSSSFLLLGLVTSSELDSTPFLLKYDGCFMLVRVSWVVSTTSLFTVLLFGFWGFSSKLVFTAVFFCGFNILNFLCHH